MEFNMADLEAYKYNISALSDKRLKYLTATSFSELASTSFNVYCVNTCELREITA